MAEADNIVGPGATEYVMIDGYLIDCSLRENHSFDSEITEYPVESGGNIVDNIRPLPIVVEMECLVTNTPIGPMVATRAAVNKAPVQDAYDLLMKIRDRREPVTIQTSLRTYEKMALKSLSIPRESGGADALRFTATFLQVKSVENKRTIRVSIPIATGTGKGNGKKSVAKPPENYPNRLILIHKTNGIWYDPDFRVWTHSARFEIVKVARVQADADSVIYNAPQSIVRWQLYRSPNAVVGEVKAEVSDLEPGADAGANPDASFWERRRFKKADIITVPISRCVLNGFVIKTPPGSPPPNNARTDAAR